MSHQQLNKVQMHCFKILQRNRELFRYEESELGDLEPLLADYLDGDKSLGEVIKEAQSRSRPQTVRVRSAEVGHVEQAMPDVLSSPTSTAETGPDGPNELEALPAIMRPDLECEMKILLTGEPYPQLNNFGLFLGLSDRLFKREGDFRYSTYDKDYLGWSSSYLHFWPRFWQADIVL